MWAGPNFAERFARPPLLEILDPPLKSMDDNCGEWVECMGVASGCGYQEVGVASGSGWNLWVLLVGGMYGCGYQEVGVVAHTNVRFLSCDGHQLYERGVVSK